MSLMFWRKVVSSNDVSVPVTASDPLPVKAASNSGVDIGDVDILSITAGDNNIGNVDVVTDPVYSTIASAEVQGNAAATQLPAKACRGMFIKAAYDNAGRVYIGASGVTKKDGTTDTTTGFELNAGDEIYLPITNSNLLYLICDNAGDDITIFYLVS